MNTLLRRITLGLLSLGLAILTVACGGGSTPALSPAPPPTGGIEGSGIAIGTISGFGSIIVNGVRFDTSGANIVVEGQPGTEAQLAVGQVVRITGRFDSNGTTGSADEVVYDDILEGPVDSIELAASRMLVLGQTVMVDEDTSFDVGIAPASLEGLIEGDIVEISGFFDSAGVIRATRIELDDDADEFELEGFVQSHDGNARTFLIGMLTVDYTSATLEGFPAGAPEDGQFVEVHGTGFGTGGELLANRVELEDRGLGEDIDEVEIEGFITRFVSATDFDVAGLSVTTDSGTVFEGGTAVDLGLNIKVEVEGSLNASGVLVATKVDIRRGNAVRVTANVDSVDAGSNTLVILGITTRTDLLTRFEDKSSADARPLTLAAINAGDYLEIRGAEMPAGSRMLLAAILEREDPDTEAELQGFIETISNPSFTILGVTIQTDGATVFRDQNEIVISADQFFNQAGPGTLVEVNGSEIADMTIAATEVELEN